jgi:acyl carrier protein
MQPVNELLRKYIAENILFTKDGYPYPDDASFLDEGIVDSTSILEIVMYIEGLGITVEDAEIVPDNFDSISKLTAYIQRKTGSSG